MATNYFHYAKGFNAPAIDRLARCILTNTCGSGEQKIIILASNHFGQAWRGLRGGEHIWALSTIEALTSLNYTLLYTLGAMDTLLIYQNLPSRLRPDVRIIWEDRLFEDCLVRNGTNYLDHEDSYSKGEWQVGKQACIKQDGYEDGIPVWNSFIFHFWKNPLSPLGSQWTLAPENYATQYEHGRGNHYLSYSIESFCKKQPFIPHSLREHRALVLGKYMRYFDPQSNEQHPWKDPQHPDQDILAPVIAQVPLSSSGQTFALVGTARRQQGSPPPEADEHWKGATMPVQAIQNLGVLTQSEFYYELGKSKVLLGVGNPVASPSPYDALCLGVPFINLIHSWDHDDPLNRFKWQARHDLLRALDPPYMYDVRKGDAEGLEAAFKSALENPIEQFIPPAMTIEAVRE
ncbi:hypothetical protein DL96DRAFT_329832 [Flagelloscypha sp. PMI_526]|nr:hypothetical protein DL96DRAFT_329832 [Flagelloscypha sp. PMI_526]